MSQKYGAVGAIIAGLFLVTSPVVVAAEPICDKADIRLVNSMREIAQPYHGLVNGGGKEFAAWAGIESDK